MSFTLSMGFVQGGIGKYGCVEVFSILFQVSKSETNPVIHVSCFRMEVLGRKIKCPFVTLGFRAFVREIRGEEGNL